MANLKNLMRRLAMSLTGLAIVGFGAVLDFPDLGRGRVIALMAVSAAWAGLELYLGLARPFEGKVPAHPLIRLSRMAWPLPLAYSWLDFRWGWTRISFPAGAFLPLLVLYGLGLALRAWAVIALGPSFSYDLKRPAGQALVTAGPYRLVRHPSYLGIAILGSLPGILLGSLPGFLGLALATIPQTLYRARQEDRLLEQEFGDAFREYARRTAMIFPFIL